MDKLKETIPQAVVNLYGGANLLPKGQRSYIFNGTDYEVTYPPFKAQNAKSYTVYSHLLGKNIEIDSDTSKAMTISEHFESLFKKPFVKDDFVDILDKTTYEVLMRTFANNGVFKDIMDLVKKTAYPNNTKKLIKNLIALHLYVMYDFDLVAYLNDAGTIDSELQAELSKILDYVQYSKLSTLYEYLQCNIEYRTINAYAVNTPNLTEREEIF